MSKTKKWITAGLILLVVGLIICAIAFSMTGFKPEKLNTVKFVSNTYDVGDDFENINIKGDTENIGFLPSEDGKCRVICYEAENETHNVRTENNTLMISIKSRPGTDLNIGVVTETPTMTVYLPKKKYTNITIDSSTGDAAIPSDFSFESISADLDTGDVACLASADGNISVKTSTGDITLKGVSAADMTLVSDTGRMDISEVKLTGNMDISENTGDVTASYISCVNFTSEGDTGSLTMTNVTAAEKFGLEHTTGDIEFNGCDAGEIYAKTDTGSVSGTLLGEKVFITKTDTGSIDVPESASGGRCEITTNTGDIKIGLR